MSRLWIWVAVSVLLLFNELHWQYGWWDIMAVIGCAFVGMQMLALVCRMLSNFLGFVLKAIGHEPPPANPYIEERKP